MEIPIEFTNTGNPNGGVPEHIRRLGQLADIIRPALTEINRILIESRGSFYVIELPDHCSFLWRSQEWTPKDLFNRPNSKRID